MNDKPVFDTGDAIALTAATLIAAVFAYVAYHAAVSPTAHKKRKAASS